MMLLTLVIPKQYSIKFNDSLWEIIPNLEDESITCYNRTSFKSMGTQMRMNENEDFKGGGNIFSYEDWVAFVGTDLLRTEKATKEALPLIYYVTQILGLNKSERMRNTKYKFSRI